MIKVHIKMNKTEKREFATYLVLIYLISFSVLYIALDQLSSALIVISTIFSILFSFQIYSRLKKSKNQIMSEKQQVPIRIEIGKHSDLFGGLNEVHLGYASLADNELIITEDASEFEFHISDSLNIRLIDIMYSGFIGFYLGSYIAAKINYEDHFIYCSPQHNAERLWINILSEFFDERLQNYKINQISEAISTLMFLAIYSLILLFIDQMILDIEGRSDLSLLILIIFGGVIGWGLMILTKLLFEDIIVERIIEQNKKFNVETVDLNRKGSPIYSPFV